MNIEQIDEAIALKGKTYPEDYATGLISGAIPQEHVGAIMIVHESARHIHNRINEVQFRFAKAQYPSRETWKAVYDSRVANSNLLSYVLLEAAVDAGKDYREMMVRMTYDPIPEFLGDPEDF